MKWSWFVCALLVCTGHLAYAKTDNYMDDKHNCTTRHIQQGENVAFVVHSANHENGDMIVVSTINVNAKLYKDGQDVSDLLESYINADTKAEGVVAYLDTVGNYRLVTTSGGQGSICVARPS